MQKNCQLKSLHANIKIAQCLSDLNFRSFRRSIKCKYRTNSFPLACSSRRKVSRVSPSRVYFCRRCKSDFRSACVVMSWQAPAPSAPTQSQRVGSWIPIRLTMSNDQAWLGASVLYFRKFHSLDQGQTIATSPPSTRADLLHPST